MGKTRDFIAGVDDANRRLDRVLRIILGETPLSSIYEALRKRRILVNGERAAPAYRLAAGDRISVDERLVAGTPPSRAAFESSPSPRTPVLGGELEAITVLRTEDLLFLDKPRGLLTHGEASLDLMVKEAFSSRVEASLSFSPAPLNRLDRNTSGLVVFSLSTKGAQAFTAMQREGGLGKSYLALLSGRLEGRRDWKDRLERDEEELKSGLGEGGELALTSVFPLLAGKDSSLALVRIQTGRTHQIRVQCSAHGHPLLGDGKYGGSGLPGGYFLHSWLLEFKDELFPDVPRLVEAPLPASWLARFEAAWGKDELGRKLREAESFNWEA